MTGASSANHGSGAIHAGGAGRGGGAGGVAPADAAATGALAPEDAMRADLYDLLAALLRAAPDAAMLRALAALEGDGSELGRAVDALARIAATTGEGEAAREYHDLFVGVGRGELVPYGSYYLTGFLNEKPLGLLRRDMARLGIERESGVREPEDHAGALMEMMAGLVRGRLGAPGAGGREDAAFFAAHVEPWAGHFFADLERARGSRLYAPVGTIGRSFMAVEAEARGMSGATSGGTSGGTSGAMSA